MRLHHSQSGCEGSQQPKNTGISGITGSHGSGRTSWGDAAGTFSLSFFECGRIDAWSLRESDRHSGCPRCEMWLDSPEKHLSSHKGKRRKATCLLNVKPPSILETGGVSAEGGELLMPLQPCVSRLCCPRVVPPPGQRQGQHRFTAHLLSPLSQRPGKTTSSLQRPCRHCYCR